MVLPTLEVLPPPTAKEDPKDCKGTSCTVTYNIATSGLVKGKWNVSFQNGAGHEIVVVSTGIVVVVVVVVVVDDDNDVERVSCRSKDDNVLTLFI